MAATATTCRRHRAAAAALVLSLLSHSVYAYKRDETLYDCNTVCPDADFNFDLEVSIEKSKIPGANVSYISRQIVGEGKPRDYILAPTLTVEVGKSFRIRIRNKIDKKESKLLGPPDETKAEYVFEADPDNGPYAGAKPYGFEFVGKQPQNASDLSITGNDPGLAYNIPHGYDATNLHFHGLEITPHLFEPIGTQKASAPFIRIQPGECYCYRFELEEDHSDGTFWYHIHHHGSSSLQSWSGMAGLFIIKGKTDKVLAEYPEEQLQESPWVLWDPHVVPLTCNDNGFNCTDDDSKAWTLVGSKRAARNYVKVGDFLMDQNDRDEALFLVNSELAPNFTAVAGQTIRYRILCATTEAFCMFRLVDKDGRPVEFWVFASDGITQSKAVKRTQLVAGGGYRNDVLVQIKEPGTYLFRQEGISNLQFFGQGPPNLTLATLEVTPAPADYPPPIDLENDLIPKLEAVSPKKGKTIRKEDIQATRHFDFSLIGNMSQAPFPQFMINDLPFNISRIAADIQQGAVEEWILTNPNFTGHPFHIHVYDMQIVEVTTNLPEVYPDVTQTPIAKQVVDSWTTEQYKTTNGPDGEYWPQARDTIIIPAYGQVKVWIRFEVVPNKFRIRGKTVFHCHFLPHEDTGMMMPWRIHETEEE